MDNCQKQIANRSLIFGLKKYILKIKKTEQLQRRKKFIQISYKVIHLKVIIFG